MIAPNTAVPWLLRQRIGICGYCRFEKFSIFQIILKAYQPSLLSGSKLKNEKVGSYGWLLELYGHCEDTASKPSTLYFWRIETPWYSGLCSTIGAVLEPFFPCYFTVSFDVILHMVLNRLPECWRPTIIIPYLRWSLYHQQLEMKLQYDSPFRIWEFSYQIGSISVVSMHLISSCWKRVKETYYFP